MNLANIGIIGHSFGGGVALQAYQDPRIKTCVDLDGKLRPENSGKITKPVLVMLSDRVDEASKKETEKLREFLAENTTQFVTIADSNHGSFTDYDCLVGNDMHLDAKVKKDIDSHLVDFFNKNLRKHDLLIQTMWHSPFFVELIYAITPLINNIIKEELGLVDKEYNFSFFMPKELLRITLYYVYGIQENDDDLLVSLLSDMQLINAAPSPVSVTSNIDFFGNQQDELVVLIDDSAKELAHLNQKIKQAVHTLNDEYTKTHGRDLYAMSKSEKFPFLPHMGLGRIRLQSIKNHIKNASETDAIVMRIRQRIKKAVVELVQKNLTLGNQKIVFDKIAVLDPQKREYIREYR